MGSFRRMYFRQGIYIKQYNQDEDWLIWYNAGKCYVYWGTPGINMRYPICFTVYSVNDMVYDYMNIYWANKVISYRRKHT